MSVFISTTPCPSFWKEGTTKCILSPFAPYNQEQNIGTANNLLLLP